MPQQSHCLDAALLFGAPSNDPLPPPKVGVITIRIPKGLSLQSLRDSPAGKRFMWQDDWYDDYPWSTELIPAGIYNLRIPVAHSNDKTVHEQVAMLPEGESLCPVVLVVAALLCIRLQNEADPLNDCWTRCAERSEYSHIVVSWFDGDRLSVDMCHVVYSNDESHPWAKAKDGGRYSDLFTSSVLAA